MLRDCADADLLLVNSDFVKKTFVDEGYPAEKIRVAYLGVREEFFDLKRDYSIEGPVRILFTGNFDIRKGVRILLEAIRSCRRSGLDLRLELMGNLGNGASCLRRATTSFLPTPPLPLSSRSLRPSPVQTCSSFPLSPRAHRALEWRPLLLVCPSSRQRIAVCRWSTERVRSMYRRTILTPSPKPSAGRPRTRSLREQIGRNAMRLVTENYTWLHYGQKVSGYFKEAMEGARLTQNAPA